MDNQTLKSQFFRSISVHLRELHVLAPFFRSIPVHFRRMLSDFPEYIRSAVHGIVSVYLRFRSISVHSFPGFSFLCAGKLTRNSTVMAGTTKDMSLIKRKHSVNHVFLSPTSIINFTSKKQSYDDTRRSSRDNELLQRAQSDL